MSKSFLNHVGVRCAQLVLGYCSCNTRNVPTRTACRPRRDDMVQSGSVSLKPHGRNSRVGVDSQTLRADRTPRGTLALGDLCPSSSSSSAHLESRAKVCGSERCGGLRAAFRSLISPGSTTTTSGSRTCRPALNWCRKRWERRTGGRVLRQSLLRRQRIRRGVLGVHRVRLRDQRVPKACELGLVGHSLCPRFRQNVQPFSTWQARADSNCHSRFRRPRSCPLDDAPHMRRAIGGDGEIRTPCLLFRKQPRCPFAPHPHAYANRYLSHALSSPRRSLCFAWMEICRGCLTSGIPASCGVRFDLRLLHPKQHATRFSQVLSPPRDRGTT